MITIKSGFSAEGKVGGYRISTHLFEVVSEGSEIFRIDVGHIAGTNGKMVFSIATDGRVSVVATGYKASYEMFKIARGMILGVNPDKSVKLEKGGVRHGSK